MTATPVHRPSIPDEDRNRILSGTHWDPHRVLGAHVVEDYTVVTTFRPGASRVTVVAAGAGSPTTEVVATDLGDGFFQAWVPGHGPDGGGVDHRLRVEYPSGASITVANAYTWLPTVGEMDLHLIAEGRHERLWEVLGSHVRHFETSLGPVEGTSFAVWAPNAQGVAVTGEFCGWNKTQFPMRSLGSSGVWELFIPRVSAGMAYKFVITTPEGDRIEKADPLARRTEVPPATASIVEDSAYQWKDADWIARREQTQWLDQPISVYEVHLESWRQGRSYADLAVELVEYVKEHGFTHVELMPVSEHPFSGSWGYQVTGYYAPTARFGAPDHFKELVDAFHREGIGVIMDWVPGHFPKDEWALARFDGRPCYEHPDWRRGEQRDWGTYVFDFGRHEVRNFLVANALYWIEEFHIDGLRVDAVASMLYLDYSRKDGEWLPNQYGGREHLEAVQFLQEMNATVKKLYPGVLTVAEESTSWPGVTAPTHEGGLGFSLKWNMGWMHDTLEYIKHDPVHRPWHHNEITFSMVYAYSEKFMLPISHDEVVHGKGTLWSRMPGDAWKKAAGLRTYLSFMWSHPGKQLLFQGQEFGQVQEWNHNESLAWGQMHGWEGEYHRGIQALVSDLNKVYRDSPALWAKDNDSAGFSWIKADDANRGVLAFARYGGGQKMVCVMNFSGTTYDKYRLGMPEAGRWVEVLNTDATCYEGAGGGNLGQIQAGPQSWDGYPASAEICVPALSAVWFTLAD